MDYERELAQDYQDEVNRVFMLTYENKPSYYGYGIDRPDLDAELSDLVDGGMEELRAAKPGLAPDDLEAAVLALTGGERDDRSKAVAMAQLAPMRASEIMRLTLPCLCCDGMNAVGLAAPPGESAAERRSLAKRGHALPDGSYPVPDVRHLHKAAVLAASGHGDVAAARKLIRKRAAELGVNLKSLPGFSDEGDEDTGKRKKKASATKRGQHLASQGSSEGAVGYPGGGEGGEGPSGAAEGGGLAATIALAEAAEDGDPASLALASNSDVVPSAFGQGVTDHVRSHIDFQVHDTGSSRDPSPRIDPDEEVARYLKQARKEFGKEKPTGANITHHRR